MDTPTDAQSHATAKRIDEKLTDSSADSGYETAAIETPAGASNMLPSSLSGSRIEQQISSREEPDHEIAGQKKDEYMNGLAQRLVQMEEELKALKAEQ